MLRVRHLTSTGFAITAAAALVLSAGTAAATATVVTAATPPRVSTAGFPSGSADSGIFTDTCTRSMTAPDDPIMMPGMTGMSMQHDFFGHTAVTASSTAATLRGGATTCSTSADASAYWTPGTAARWTAGTVRRRCTRRPRAVRRPTPSSSRRSCSTSHTRRRVEPASLSRQARQHRVRPSRDTPTSSTAGNSSA